MEKKWNIKNLKEDEMKTTCSSRLITMLLIGALVLLGPQLALATGTAVCTSVINQATVNYNGSLNVTSVSDGTNTFDVANKVVPIVVQTDGALVSIVAGATVGVLTFTVTNDGNSVQDYALTGLAQANGTADPFGGAQADNFDAAGFAVYVENGTTAGYQSSGADQDTAAFIDELAASGVATVYVVVTGAPAIALAQGNGSVAVYSLNANTYDGGAVGLGAETTNATLTGACNAPTALADTAAGTGLDDGDLDGADSDRSAFVVASSVISISKTVNTIWDPINYDVAPKAIPLALVQYVITIANAPAATASATLTTITDGLVGSLAMDPDLLTNFTVPATPAAESAAGSGFKAIVTGGTRVGAAGSPLANGVAEYYTTTSSVDGIDLAAPNITATLATILPADAGGGAPYTAGELKPGETLTITFNAVIQ